MESNYIDKMQSEIPRREFLPFYKPEEYNCIQEKQLCELFKNYFIETNVKADEEPLFHGICYITSSSK